MFVNKNFTRAGKSQKNYAKIQIYFPNIRLLSYLTLYNVNVNKCLFFCLQLTWGLAKDKCMKVKLLLKFYFGADSLNERLDKLIEYHACRTDGSSFEKVAALIEDKKTLCKLMDYLEGKFDKLTQRDISALERYAKLRVSVQKLEDDVRRDIKRAVMKFTRKLTFLERHEEEVKTLKNYRAILN